MADLKPWPTPADVAARLRVPLATLTPEEQTLLGEQLAAAVDTARVVPEWREASQIPVRVWEAVRGLAALDFRIANAPSGIDTNGNPDQGNVNGARWRYMLTIGYGRGGRPRVG